MLAIVSGRRSREIPQECPSGSSSARCGRSDMARKTVLLCGPVTEELGPDPFNNAELELSQARRFIVLNPVASHQKEFRRNSLLLLAEADALALLPNWIESAWVCLQVQIAKEMGLDIHTLHYWLNWKESK